MRPHRRRPLHRCCAGALLVAALAWPAGASAGSREEGPVTLSVDVGQELGRVPGHFLGINLSYFNDTEDLWRRHGILDTLRAAGIAALRYPGGQETSFFHWRHPGVNGYEDLWDDPKVRGTAVGRGRFQATWVDPSQWEQNREFMDFDRFMACCRALGAEPVVGLNLSSGRKHHRREDGLAEALEWMRHAASRGDAVTYWYLDNEPWNFGANLPFSDEDYVEEILLYGRAIRREFPHAKLIINPLSAAQVGDWPRLERIVRTVGGVVDYVDVHFYWEWGRSSLAVWQAKTPMEDHDQWKPAGQAMPYADELARVHETCARAGFPGIGVMALEWNIGPSAASRAFPPALAAVIQAEMLLQFIEARVEIACLWPLIWRSNPAVWPEANRFPSIVTGEAPFERTPTCDLFRLAATVPGSVRVAARADGDGLCAGAFLAGEGRKLRLLVVNKASVPRRVVLRVAPRPAFRLASAESVSADGTQAARSPHPDGPAPADVILPPLSASLLVLEGTPP